MINELKKTSKEFIIIEKDNETNFIIKKNKKKIIIHDSKIIEDMIDNKFMSSYKNLLAIIIDLINSDDANDSDEAIVRNNIEELKYILLNKYAKFIKLSQLNKYLKMLMLLESKINFRYKGRGR